MRADAGGAQHIDTGAEKVLKILTQTDEVHQAGVAIRVNQQVDIAAWPCLPALQRTKQTDVACTR